MSKAFLGITSIPHGLTTLSGLPPPPCMIPMMAHGHPSHHSISQEPPPLIGNTPLIMGFTSPTCPTGHSLAHMDVEVLIVRPQH